MPVFRSAVNSPNSKTAMSEVRLYSLTYIRHLLGRS